MEYYPNHFLEWPVGLDNMMCIYMVGIQPSQNVPAEGDFAANNEMSAAYFIVKFTNNKYEVPSAAYYSSHLACYSKTF